MLFSTISNDASAMFWTPAGTSAFFRPPRMKSVHVAIVEISSTNAVLLKPVPSKNSGQTNRWLTGGNSRAPSTGTVTSLLGGEVGGADGLRRGRAQARFGERQPHRADLD